MQAAAAQVVPKLFLADLLVRERRDASLAQLLLELADVLKEFRTIFREVSGVDPDIFWDIYRPCLAGFFPDGVALCGVPLATALEAAEAGFIGGTTIKPAPLLGAEVEPVSAERQLVGDEEEAESRLASVARGERDVQAAGRPTSRPALPPHGDAGVVAMASSKGPSAGQSTMILLIDSFLGVEHDASGSAFQDEMMGYMPEPHRRMVRDYRQKWTGTKPVRQYVSERRANGEGLVEAFDECVGAMRDFRKFHLATVTRYLPRTGTGTGASTWRTFLQGCLDRTQAASLHCPCK